MEPNELFERALQLQGNWKVLRGMEWVFELVGEMRVEVGRGGGAG